MIKLKELYNTYIISEFTKSDYIEIPYGQDDGIDYDTLEDEGLEDYEDDILDKIDTLEKESGIHFTRDRFIDTILFHKKDNKVVGVLYYSDDTDKFTFDVIVSKDYRNKGIASYLVELALDFYNSDTEMFNNKIEVDAVNPIMANLLKTKFNFKVKEKLPGREILTL